MGSKKHIDKFFQEQFRDFEAKPPQHVWDNINNELEKENPKQKRVIPLWFQLSGVAASLIFLIIVGLFQLTSEDNIIDNQVAEENNNTETAVVETNANNTNSIVDKEPEIVRSHKNKISTLFTEEQQVTSASISERSNVINKTIQKTSKNAVYIKGKLVENPSVIQNNGAYSDSNHTESTDSEVTNKVNSIITTSESGNEVIVVDKALVDDVLENNQFNKSRKTNNNRLVVSKTDLDTNNISDNNVSEKFANGADVRVDDNRIVGQSKSTSDNNEQLTLNSDFIDDRVTKENSIVVSNSKNSSVVDQIKNKSLENKLLEQTNKSRVAIDDVTATENKPLVGDNCEDEEEEEVEELPIDKTIEEAIAEQTQKEEEVTDNEVEAYKKWKIAPNVAPVYYNSLTSGSPIDDDFSGNTKKGQFTTSYGIGVGYALNKRLSVRTGVNKLEVGYDTQDVAIYSSPETSGNHNYKNINFSSEGSGMSIVGSGTYSATQIPSSFSSLFDSSLNQRFGYIEVPLELSYKLSDKKLRVDVIAGISTFFLNKNEIYSENKTKTTYIGEANNLNNTSYSTNFGIGLEYKLSKTLNFNFDPMFKYQLNAFSNDAGNFKPYILGIYSGLSYRF